MWTVLCRAPRPRRGVNAVFSRNSICKGDVGVRLLRIAKNRTLDSTTLVGCAGYRSRLRERTTDLVSFTASLRKCVPVVSENMRRCIHSSCPQCAAVKATTAKSFAERVNMDVNMDLEGSAGTSGDGHLKVERADVGLRKKILNNRWAKLIKLDLSALVVVTSAGGYVLAGGSIFDITTMVGLVSGTMMCAASASTFNQVIEKDYDALMQRTRMRPLVTGTISLYEAKTFGFGMAAGGMCVLYFTTSSMTAVLGGATILLYTHVYTPFKRKTRFNTEVGALVGAIPPVMGWTAAFGSVGVASAEALFLAGMLFAWQMHHFMTIAWSRREDYKIAGYVMQSLNDPTGDSTLRKGWAWALSNCLFPPISCALGFTNPMFMLTGSIANGMLISSYWKFFNERTNKSARKALVAGLLQLVALFTLMTFHLQDRDNITAFKQMNQLRLDGLSLCVFHYHKYMKSPDICVYLFGNSKTTKDLETCNCNKMYHERCVLSAGGDAGENAGEKGN